jgi:hypothetical protein
MRLLIADVESMRINARVFGHANLAAKRELSEFREGAMTMKDTVPPSTGAAEQGDPAMRRSRQTLPPGHRWIQRVSAP